MLERPGARHHKASRASLDQVPHMARLRSLPPRLGKAPSRWPRQAKQTEAHYGTAAHKAWAQAVKERAAYRCQQCGAQGVRLIADHVQEISDGGAKLDPMNGKALCSACHGVKTHLARMTRLQG